MITCAHHCRFNHDVFVILFSLGAGENGVYYCGSYAAYGMGLLEQGVESAERVAELILADRRTNNFESSRRSSANSGHASKDGRADNGKTGIEDGRY